jgi:hypothetical protein
MGPGALESTVTPDLLKEAGYTHLLDWPRRPADLDANARELNHAGAQAHRDHTGRQLAERIVDQFEVLEQSRPQGCAPAQRRPMPPLGHFLLIRFEWLPAGTDGRGREGAEKIDRRQRA